MENNPLETLQVLEQRVKAQEQANLQAFQKQILQELKTLREALLAESKTSSAAATASTDQKKDKRITELQTQNRRLQYRIVHLTRNLKQALQKQ